MSKERSWEEFGLRLDSIYTPANQVFWQTIRRLRRKRLSATTSIKDSTGSIPGDEKEILSSRWKEYCKDLLNPGRAKPTDTCETIDFMQEKLFTFTEVAAVTRGLKSGKAAGENEIKPEMLKALNGEGVRWLTRVCQMA